MPNWKKVITSGSNAELSSLFVAGAITASGAISASGAITGSDVYINDWGSVSASLAAAGGGGAVATYTNGSDNRIITSTGTDGINGEANLTFDGTSLTLTGNITASGNVSSSGTSDNFFGGRLVLDNSKYVAGTETGGTTRNILSIDGSNITQVANGNIATNIKGTSITIANDTTIQGALEFTPSSAIRGVYTDIETNWESAILVSSGEYIEVGANVSRTQHDLFNLSGSWGQANSGDVSTAIGLLGVAVDANTANDWLVKGTFNIADANLAGHPAEIGSPVYVGATSGKYTVTPPTSAGDVVRVVGHIADTYVSGRTTYYKIYFNPSPDWIEL